MGDHSPAKARRLDRRDEPWMAVPATIAETVNPTLGAIAIVQEIVETKFALADSAG
ncbi:hypothetical protein GCM10011504_58930 [Siccirubricoccus deserti]|nr:hypothetical protein GCM10011504_58930 [Siccirubricoccus deserti]